TETTVLDARDDRERAAAVVAEQYFRDRQVNEQMLAELLDRLSRVGGKAVVILPPQHKLFEQQSVRIAGELQNNFREKAAVLVRSHGLALIDCSDMTNCGLASDMFADVVHLNARGTIAFTASLAEKLNTAAIRTESR